MKPPAAAVYLVERWRFTAKRFLAGDRGAQRLNHEVHEGDEGHEIELSQKELRGLRSLRDLRG
jgi:hypothetical protein